MSVDQERREQLRRAKLGALARDQLGMTGEAVTAGPVTGLLAGDRAAVLVEHGGPASLAGALMWAGRQRARRLVVLADDGAERTARLASYFAFAGESVEVFGVSGAELVTPVPEPLEPPPAEPEGAEPLIAVLREAGVEVVVEHGVVRGEVLGLEVARLVRWPSSVGGDDELHLEAGVGRFDRDANAAARPDESPTEALRRVVESVRRYRFPGAGVHPMQMLARERWIRSTLIEDPSVIAARSLRAAGMTAEADGLKDAHPAAAVGTDERGEPIVVVCSTGVDLALVPLAADARQLHAPGARLVLAVPERDQHPATRDLVGMLREPADLVAVDTGWG